MSGELVPIIQADRASCAEYMIQIGRVHPSSRGHIEAGGWDGTADVQAFARHRIAGQAELVEALAVVRAMLAPHEGQQSIEGEALKVAEAALSQHSGERS